MKCLLIRQPYASLISYGIKRIEFRNGPSKFRGLIALASSRGPPIKTTDEKLNVASKNFPRGKILALANLRTDQFLDNIQLSKYYTGTTNKKIHEIEFELAKSPLGEPISDIKEAISDYQWRSYGWFLSKIIPICDPIDLTTIGYGPWINLDEKEEWEIKNYVDNISSVLDFNMFGSSSLISS